jgi:cell division protein FtsL
MRVDGRGAAAGTEGVGEMVKLNIVLLLIAIGCALGVVTSQHHARKLFVALEKERGRAKQLEVEFGQLQLEASTWGMQGRVEKLAAAQLGMRPLTPNRVQVLSAEAQEKTK